MTTTQHLYRYFCTIDDRDQINREGRGALDFPIEQETFPFGPNEVFAKGWNAFDEYRSIVLLSPPRHGKTTEFRYHAGKANHSHFLALREINGNGLESAFSREHKRKWEKWLETEHDGELFLDGLDEGRLDSPRFFLDIVDKLYSLGREVLSRLRIHISCREVDWRHIDEVKWESLLQETTPANRQLQNRHVVLHLLNLHLNQVEGYCIQNGVDFDQLFSSLPDHARHLMSVPSTLNMLLEACQRKEQISGNLEILYKKAIVNRLDELNEYRQDLAIDTLPISDRLSLARHYAAMTVLTGREIISRHGFDPERHVPIMASGKTLPEHKELFSTSLFESYSRGQYRFANPQLADYLAAAYLHDCQVRHNLKPERIVGLFFADAAAETVVPRLEEVAKWLCALNAPIRHAMLARCPEVVITEYISGLPDDEKVFIWEWIRDSYLSDDWFQHVNSKLFFHLRCPVVIHDVRQLLQRSWKLGKRFRSYLIAAVTESEVHELDPEMERILIDSKQNHDARENAAFFLGTQNKTAVRTLRRWLTYNNKIDSTGRFRASALTFLWPDHLPIEDLIHHLSKRYPFPGHSMFHFICTLTKQLNPSDRAKVIDALDSDIRRVIAHASYRDRGSNRFKYDHIFVWEEFDRFLELQIRVWQDDETRVSVIESWLSTWAEASNCRAITPQREDEICKIVLGNRRLQRAVCLQKLQRLHAKWGKNTFLAPSWLDHEIFRPRDDDLEYWDDLLTERCLGNQLPFNIGYGFLRIAWQRAGSPSSFVDNLLERFSHEAEIRQLISARFVVTAADEIAAVIDRVRGIGERRERTMTTTLQMAIAHRRCIEEGHEKWLRRLVRVVEAPMPLRVNQEDVEELLAPVTSRVTDRPEEPSGTKQLMHLRLGTSLAQSLSEGLARYWEHQPVPRDTPFYSAAGFEGWSKLVSFAVTLFCDHSEEYWTSVPPQERRKAIVSAFRADGYTPTWLGLAIQQEQSFFVALCDETISLECKLPTHIDARLAKSLRDLKLSAYWRQVAWQVLHRHDLLPWRIYVPLLRTIASQVLNTQEQEILFSILKTRLQGPHPLRALAIAAAAWRYYHHSVLDIIVAHFPVTGTQGSRVLRIWFKLIVDIHFAGRIVWPVWVTPAILTELLPYLLDAYPFGTFPGLLGAFVGSRTWSSSDLCNLRDDALKTIANSGTSEAKAAIEKAFFGAPKATLAPVKAYYIDQWRKSRATHGWTPPTPEELAEILSRGAASVRNSSDLFVLVCELISEIKEEFEKGEMSLKDLLWYKHKQRWFVRHEISLQVMVADKLRHHPIILTQRIIAGRELNVGGNRPDIFVSCVIPNGCRAKVYIEVKRQHNPLLFQAIENQLRAKYLGDPEAEHGIYLVGWYGLKYFGCTHAELVRSCGKVPRTARELEYCLQDICDNWVKQSERPVAMRVFVFDLARNF